MQPHHLHQHLVRVRRAVEGAGARPVIGLRFRLEEFGASDLALGIKLADARLLVVGQPRRHRPRRHEDCGKMAEGEGRDSQPRHDLVADAEIDRRVEHVVRKTHGRRHRDHVPRKERKLHPRLALRDAVAHRRHPARHLRDAAGFPRRVLDQFRIGLEGLMRRKHVVVGGDDAEIGHHVAGQRRLVGRPAGGKSVGKVAAGKRRAMHAPRNLRLDALQIGFARTPRALADAVRNGGDGLVEAHDRSTFYGAQ